jgi:hypothetical protein
MKMADGQQEAGILISLDTPTFTPLSLFPSKSAAASLFPSLAPESPSAERI